MTKNDWALELAKRFTKNLVKHRNNQRLSVAKLAQLTEEAGYHVTASVIANMESGRRGARLDVAEVLILSHVLNVPPALMLVGDYPDGINEFLPGVEGKAFHVVDWIDGRAQVSFPVFDSDAFSPHPIYPVSAVAEREGLEAQAVGLMQLGGGNPIRLIEQMEKRRKEINNELQERGYTVDNGEG